MWLSSPRIFCASITTIHCNNIIKWSWCLCIFSVQSKSLAQDINHFLIKRANIKREMKKKNWQIMIDSHASHRAKIIAWCDVWSSIQWWTVLCEKNQQIEMYQSYRYYLYICPTHTHTHTSLLHIERFCLIDFARELDNINYKL